MPSRVSTKAERGAQQAAALLRDLTGCQVERGAGADLIGLPYWCIKVARVKTCGPTLMARWWADAVQQAQIAGRVPLLLVRPDRGEWSARWPAAVHAGGNYYDPDPAHAVHASLDTWYKMTCALLAA